MQGPGSGKSFAICFPPHNFFRPIQIFAPIFFCYPGRLRDRALYRVWPEREASVCMYFGLRTPPLPLDEVKNRETVKKKISVSDIENNEKKL